ncbi:MAG: class A beta-lactamase-related serine hydrolase [Chitinophagaceae bacterium]|nr:MAG: class A beta-lactamase-related serine hydrolase [Chitinophagaceae bacterium]
MAANKSIHSVAMKVESGDGSISLSAAAGGMQVNDRYFIASVTKLYITAVVMKLVDENKISLNSKITEYLSEDFCERLHVMKEVDYSKEITICHLISNTSGIPDYFSHKQLSGKTVADELIAGKDEAWPIDKSIELIKSLKPKFKPGTKGKAAYSDSNYQLLGKIIETITGKTIGEVFQDYIFSKLDFKNTYLYSDINDKTPVPFYYGSEKLWLPNYMTSIGPEGGIVSTIDEVMIFLKAFFNGQFFEKEKIEALKKWNMIYPPPGLFCYGIGLEKLWIPWIASPFKYPGEILGFWGQTGTFAFYNPKTDLYFSGATNQINGTGHRLAAGAMLKLIKTVM